MHRTTMRRFHPSAFSKKRPLIDHLSGNADGDLFWCHSFDFRADGGMNPGNDFLRYYAFTELPVDEICLSLRADDPHVGERLP